MKYLLLFGLFAVIWWVWSKRKASADVPPARPASPDAEKMVSCAQCGVYLPESDSISEGGQAYCCEAHRAQGRSAERR
ncbi:PP0621 family protein [Dechloromonas sp. ARDL1]|uniref:PP0621 family protein n=1 Tax=Dechloromonas sp. ARDL1 TaxID=3322121 RepID=UPI003DA785BA